MNEKLELVVESGDADTRIDQFLARKIEKYSRSQIQKWIKEGHVSVNEEKVSAHYSLKEGDEVVVDKESLESARDKETQKSIPDIEVVSETSEFVVMNKPTGVVVHPESKHKSGTVVDFLLARYPEISRVGDDPARPGIVHRLDKEASGLLVAARTKPSFESLKKQFQEHTIEKEYMVAVYGRDLPDEGEITSAIKRSVSGRMAAVPKSDRPGRFVVSEVESKEDEGPLEYARGKLAHTLYTVIDRQKDFALLRVKTLTGRTHQIRVHFYSMGHPVLGDTLYHPKNVSQNTILPPRLFLHAVKLAFADTKGERCAFELTLAKDLETFWQGLTPLEI